MGMGLGAAVAGVGSIVGGFVNNGRAGKMRRKAQRYIDNFEWQDLNNAYSDLQVSTLGSDLQREENTRFNAGALNTLANSGSRNLVAGLGGLVANNTEMNRSISANLDEQQAGINYAAAQDDARIRSMIEQRQANELAGYGQMLDVANSLQNDSMSQIINGFGSLASGFGSMIPGKKGA